MKVLLCLGSRLDAIKLAPVYHALKPSALEPFVLHAGQDAALESLCDFFEMAPVVRLAPHCKRPTLGHLGAVLMEQADLLLGRVPAGAVLVHGASAPALALAQVARYHGIPVGHLAADLPAAGAALPFPEAPHRAMIAALASWHFAAMPETVKALEAAGCPAGTVYYVRNTIVDATQWGLQHLLSHSARTPADAAFFAGDLIKRLQNGRVLLVHTPGRVHDGAALAEIAQAMTVLIEAHDELRVVWPTHGRAELGRLLREAVSVLDPRVRARLILAETLSYPQLLWLLKQTWLVVTDANELHEEAATLHVPMLVLQGTGPVTPDPAPTGGRAVLKTDPKAIYLWVARLLGHPEVHHRMAMADNPFGDGRAGQHIARILQRELAKGAARPAAPISNAA